MYRTTLLSILLLSLQAHQTQAKKFKKKKTWLYSSYACADAENYSDDINLYDYGKCITTDPERRSLFIKANDDEAEHCLQMSNQTCNGDVWGMPFNMKTNPCYDIPPNPDGYKWMSWSFVQGACDQRSLRVLPALCKHDHKNGKVSKVLCDAEIKAEAVLKSVSAASLESSASAVSSQASASTESKASAEASADASKVSAAASKLSPSTPPAYAQPPIYAMPPAPAPYAPPNPVYPTGGAYPVAPNAGSNAAPYAPNNAAPYAPYAPPNNAVPGAYNQPIMGRREAHGRRSGPLRL